MTDYHAPEIPQDPVLLELHAAAGELIGIVTRRLLNADPTEAARIVELLQEAAGAQRRPGAIMMPDGSIAYPVTSSCPATSHRPEGDPPCHLEEILQPCPEHGDAVPHWLDESLSWVCHRCRPPKAQWFDCYQVEVPGLLISAELPPELLTDDPEKSLAFQVLAEAAEDLVLNGNRKPGDPAPVGVRASIEKDRVVDAALKGALAGETYREVVDAMIPRTIDPSAHGRCDLKPLEPKEPKRCPKCGGEIKFVPIYGARAAFVEDDAPLPMGPPRFGEKEVCVACDAEPTKDQENVGAPWQHRCCEVDGEFWTEHQDECSNGCGVSRDTAPPLRCACAEEDRRWDATKFTCFVCGLPYLPPSGSGSR